MDTVPLMTQLALFEQRWIRVISKLEGDLRQLAYLNHLHDLARQRIIDGHALYGDEMYHWGDPCRRANMDEKLADYVVYGTSESDRHFLWQETTSPEETSLQTTGSDADSKVDNLPAADHIAEAGKMGRIGTVYLDEATSDGRCG